MRRGLGILVLVAPLLTGCAAAAGAAAGTAAGMAYEDRGAESYVPQSVATVAGAARTALASMGVTLTASESQASDNEVELKGKSGSQEVNVEIHGNSDANRTHIFVSVKKNMVDYDKSRANELLQGILRQLKQ